jgi:hypothetical protein
LSEETQSKINKNSLKGAGCPWLMLIILATQEAENRRIAVQSHLQANSSRDPLLKKKKNPPKKSWWSDSSSKSLYLASMRP